MAPVINHAADYELQIIYTQINRDAQNQPHFIQHDFRLDAKQYFNPASLVKLPIAALALEKLNELHQPGLTRRSPMVTRTAFRCQTAVPYNPAADSDRINTVGNYIKRMLLVSDNNAYNRLYEFLGQRPLNERLAQLGYSNTRITRRFAPCDTTANRHTNPIDFLGTSGQLIYQQPALFNPSPFNSPLGRIAKGRAYQAGGQIVPRPYDFTTANYLPLQDVTDILKSLLFPEVTSSTQRFNLTPNDYAFLRYYLHHTPHSSAYRPYATKQFFDAYKKYLYYGRSPQVALDSAFRIYNVVGMSHGYLSDAAYFISPTQHSEFLLSAVLYVNQDGIINDGAYEYNSIGLPFLAQLGQLIQQYETTHRQSEASMKVESFPAEVK
ncbi:serine hydrolase [Hymenobacter volaticus]|uniref:Class A beta-lactamase-related serine hydrolase n=1 Tax=Hymenobacter volaticus TaxID=2932254 RepID=A0ABY4G7L2_9BACT|nr:serine hydrolase [Hymenobacter volaticus]UOQ66827.1 class A beta-lactamase-related serine hydrolase [Hymenobacter volaticus]